jgi:hypothetical protein
MTIIPTQDVKVPSSKVADATPAHFDARIILFIFEVSSSQMAMTAPGDGPGRT